MSTYEEERARIAAAADPATTHAFDRITRAKAPERVLNPPNPLFPQCEDPSEWPVLGENALYGLPGEVVAELSPHTEADPVNLLVTFLTTFGAAVGRGPHMVADGAEHPGRIFTVIVGDTSKGRKGTGSKQIRLVFMAADRTFTEDGTMGGFGSGEALVDSLAEGDDKRRLVYEPEWARILSVGRRERRDALSATPPSLRRRSARRSHSWPWHGCRRRGTCRGGWSRDLRRAAGQAHRNRDRQRFRKPASFGAGEAFAAVAQRGQS